MKKKNHDTNQGNRGERTAKAVRGLTVAAVLLATTLSFAAKSGSAPALQRLSPELQRLSASFQSGSVSNQTVRVIVQFTAPPTQYHRQKMAKLGGHSFGKLNLIHGQVFTMPLKALSALDGDSDVVHVAIDHTVSMTSSDAFEATVGATVAHTNGWDGTGVGVAVIDSGISDHPDLRDPVTGLSRVVYNEVLFP